MKKKWSTERKWDANKVEERFEELLKENGYTMKGIKEFATKTDYLIEKDGIKVEWCIWRTVGAREYGDKNFECFERLYTMQSLIALC